METADAYREEHRYAKSGEFYSVAAYEYLGDGPPSIPGTKYSHGLFALLLGSTCFRLAGQLARCENRCRQGLLVAEDMLHMYGEEREVSNDYEYARKGAWHEFIGDFRTLGGLTDAEIAYDTAEQIYRAANNPPTAHREQEHMWLMRYLELVAGETLDSTKYRRIIRQTTLLDWLAYKRQELPTVLEAVFERGTWIPDNDE